MRAWGLKISVLLAALALAACGGSNYLTSMADKNSDAAVYEDVLKLVDAKAWTDALDRLDDMSTEYRNHADVVQTEAGIYAGQCGLDFLTFASGLGGSSGVFGMFFSGFSNLTPNTAKCQASQSHIESKFGATSLIRTANLGAHDATNVNTFMAILGAAKIGAQLKQAGDASPVDGSIDAGFDACSTGSISHAQVAQVGTGFALMLMNFSTIAASFDPNVADNLEQLIDDCSAVDPSPCEVTDPNDSIWSDPVARGMVRSLIASQSFGVGSCNNANVFTCCPPVP